MLNIDGKEYTEDQLNDEQKYLVMQLQSIENQMKQIQFQADQLMAAKNMFLPKLKESLEIEDAA